MPPTVPAAGRAVPADAVPQGAPGVGSSAPPLAAAPAAAGQVVWEFSVRDGFKAFDGGCQEEVERLYQAYRAGTRPAVGRLVTAQGILLVDFAVMRQQMEGSARKRDVRRSVLPP